MAMWHESLDTATVLIGMIGPILLIISFIIQEFTNGMCDDKGCQSLKCALLKLMELTGLGMMTKLFKEEKIEVIQAVLLLTLFFGVIAYITTHLLVRLTNAESTDDNARGWWNWKKFMYRVENDYLEEEIKILIWTNLLNGIIEVVIPALLYLIWAKRRTIWSGLVKLFRFLINCLGCNRKDLLTGSPAITHEKTENDHHNNLEEVVISP